MPNVNVTGSTIPRRQKNSILRSKVLEKKLPHQHGKTLHSTFEDRRLLRLDQVAKALAAELGRVREKERQKIAGDLHDHIGQNLVLAKMKLDALKSSLGHEHAALITGISDLIKHTIKDTRSLMHELDLEWLSQLSLQEALNWLAEQTKAKYGLRCIVKFGPLPKPLKKDIQEALFQAVRELLVNVVKHASAHEVSITCDCETGGIRLCIADDGEGFDSMTSFTPSPTSGGFGLMIIRTRLGLIGGNLYIDSRVGAGTRAIISLPVNAN
jgi:signal transduction histidine kinase